MENNKISNNTDPISLKLKARALTVVIANENCSEYGLAETFREAYEKQNEYYFLSFNDQDDDCIEKAYSELESNLVEHILFNNDSFTFIIYEKLASLSIDRAGKILEFVQRMRKEFSGGDHIIRLVFNLIAENHMKQADKEAALESLSSLRSDFEKYPWIDKAIFFVKSLPMRDISLPLKATVRYSFLLTHIEPVFCSNLNIDHFNRDRINHVTITDFDLDEKVGLDSKIANLEELLKLDNGQSAIFENNSDKIVKQLIMLIENEAAAFDTSLVPMPFFGMVKKCGRFKSTTTLDTLKSNLSFAVEKSFNENIENRIIGKVLDRISDENIGDTLFEGISYKSVAQYGKEWMKNLPDRDRNQTLDMHTSVELSRFHPEKQCEREASKLFKTLLDNCMKTVRKRFIEKLHEKDGEGRELIDRYLQSAHFTHKIVAAESELSKCRSRLYEIGAIGSAEEYVKNADSLTRKKISARYNELAEAATELLFVSKKIADDWKYGMCIPESLSKNVYEIGRIDEQEFETMILHEYDFDTNIKKLLDLEE